MGEMEEISKEQLRAIRSLNDPDLVRLMTEVSQYGWAKASEFLKLMIQESEAMSDELVKRIGDLERELAELRAAKDKAEELPAYMSHFKRPTEEPEKPKPMPKYDPTENFRLPPSAVKAMAAIVPDPKPSPGFNRHSWAQNKGPGEPGGFGPKPGPSRTPEVERGSGWSDPHKLEGMVRGRWSKNDWEEQ